MVTQFPDSIFKAYDIRGLVESELSDELAYRIGWASVQLLKEKDAMADGQALVVGYDMRETSQPFAAAVRRGIRDAGVDVVDIGFVSTPLFNFACADVAAYAGGVMVTASHNPGAYNGFKITMGDGLPVGRDSGMDRIRELVQAGDFTPAVSVGEEQERDMFARYWDRVRSLLDITAIRPLKVVIDAGNGMAAATFPKWLDTLPVEVEYLYLDADGDFPNHEANPLKVETLTDLQAKVKEVGADIGFALDGDADRIGVVDEHGDVVEASYVGALIGREVLKVHPNAHMLYDLRSSRIVKDVWERAGATTEMSMVGHALIKQMMRDVDATFASELSLHLYFGDMYNLESTDLCLLYFLRLLSQSDRPLSEHVKPLRVYHHSGEINFEVGDKQAVLARIENQYGEKANALSKLDGLWLSFDWGFVSVRQSNTEAVLRLNLEADDKATMEEKVAEFRTFICL